MNLEIIGAESLGVRSLCCFIETGDRAILIDPGVALGYLRNSLLPHPVQVAAVEVLRSRIIERWARATDIVISHFHGDHTPLPDANPFQLSVKSLVGLNDRATLWTKGNGFLSPREKARAHAVSEILGKPMVRAEGLSDGPLTFSEPVRHGRDGANAVTVMMTRVRGEITFVHGSDNQLMSAGAMDIMRSWAPDVLLTDGPPIYLSGTTEEDAEIARDHALALARACGKVIIDHHPLRSRDGIAWFERLASNADGKISCGAEQMERTPVFLEADRELLYDLMPVPEGWHRDYADGRADTRPFVEMARTLYPSAAQLYGSGE